MNYQAAISYILSFTDYEKSPSYLYSAANFDLRRMARLLQLLGNPHLRARSVHITGTKGKGSTATMIAAALGEAGWRTGLYTSPHLHTMRERIVVDGKLITEGELAALMSELCPLVEEVNRDRTYGQLTTFEILTALGFMYFGRRKVDFQVVEVGLGGRLDATNVIEPEVCVLTHIGLDHMAILGDTVAKIATEKVGIIKNGAAVVSAPQQPDAEAIISQACREKKAKLIRVGSDITWQKLQCGLWGQTLSVKGLAASYELTIPLLGDHQMENAACAVAALEALGTPKEAITSGLGKVRLSGRLEVLRQEPLVVVDGAHNIDSAAALREALRQCFDFERTILIIGTSSDKDVAGMVRELAPAFKTAIATRSRHPRSLEPSVLAAELLRHGFEVHITGSVAEAVGRGLAMAGRRDLLCVTGSFFVVAEAIEYLKGLSPELYPAGKAASPSSGG